jgi:predicted outer membrane repeat protein
MSRRQRRRRQERRSRQRHTPSKRRLAAAGGLTAGATLAFAGVAHADTFTVSNLNDAGPGSLRQAITDANTNGNGSAVDDVVFASGLSGTIDVGSTAGFGLYPETAMNIQGPGAGTIRLNAVPSIDYVVFTGIYYDGTPGDPITISGLTISGGSAVGRPGGGIENHTANLTVSKAVITGNSSDEDGGGIYSDGAPGNLTLIDSTVSGNTAEPTTGSYGGGIFAGSDAKIQGSAIFDNNARDGGGVYSSSNDPNNLVIQRSTIANNHAVNDDGGGVWFCCGESGEKLTVQGSTITGNTSLTQGGGLNIYLSDVTYPRPEIDNTIISGNSSTNFPEEGDFRSDFPADVAFSLITNLGNGQVTETVPGSNLIGANPQLGPLQNNGGPSPTQALPSTSPAVDKGAAFGLGSDQRGVLRPIDFPSIANSAAAGADGSDIGAFELQPDNALKLGKLKRNKKKGTAKQVVLLPLPDAGSVTISGKGLKTKTRTVADNGKVKLPVIAKGKKRAQENRTGKVKLKAKITYNATGNAAKTLKRKLKLIKRLG